MAGQGGKVRWQGKVAGQGGRVHLLLDGANADEYIPGSLSPSLPVTAVGYKDLGDRGWALTERWHAMPSGDERWQSMPTGDKG